MKHNVYQLRDLISNSVLLIGMAPTDGAFIRDTVSQVYSKYRIHEAEVSQIGTFDVETSKLEACPLRICDINSYKRPEMPVQPMREQDVAAVAQHIVSALVSK